MYLKICRNVFIVKIIHKYNPRENADMSNEKGKSSP